MKLLRILDLAILTSLILGVVPLKQLFAKSDPSINCFRNLSDVRKEWKAVAGKNSKFKSLEGCREEEKIWKEMRQCFTSSGRWLPPMQRIGDCFIFYNRLEEAKDFYEWINQYYSEEICSIEGVSCYYYASEELRLLDCGFNWLTDSKEKAWSDYLHHLEPNVSPGSVHNKDYDSRVKETKCPKNAFEPLKSIIRSDSIIKKADINKGVIIPIDKEDYPSSNLSWEYYSHFYVKACPYYRVSLGKKESYYVTIQPVQKDSSDPWKIDPCGEFNYWEEGN
jgi:hypothetical protein